MHIENLEKIPAGVGKVTLRGPCAVTGEIHETPPVDLAAVELYEAGMLAQLAFPDLPAPEREFLISGTSPEGWRKVFGNGPRNWEPEEE